MTQNYDAIVIGGGITGAWISLELARLGADRVLLIEKSFPGAGSTGNSSAILSQDDCYEIPIRMASFSLERYASFQAENGLDIGFRRVGMVCIADASEEASLRASVTLQNQNHVQASVIGPDELRELEPEAVFNADDRALWDPDAGTVQPAKTVHACLEAARRQGVETRFGVAVRAIEVEGGRVTGVRLSDGVKVSGPHVINAAGPWAKQLLKTIAPDLPLRSIRREQAYFEPPVTEPARRTIFCDTVTGLYWKPEDAGWTRVGQLSFEDAAEVDPDHFDEGIAGEFIHRCRRGISERLPSLGASPSKGGGAALYTVTPDSRAIVGTVPGVEGLTVVAGASGHDFKFGPAVGRGVAGMVVGGDTGPFDPAFFSVDRFCGVRAAGGRAPFRILG